ncbi:phage tail protein [Pseudovibrio ascidiaceicola]|uniref:phage tail protein n=1 Tax=Pseudovibrio ascidiaceicola TaxID=285279 RepID=UPI003D36E072
MSQRLVELKAKIEDREVREMAERLSEKRLNQAFATAINSTLTTVRVQATKMVRKQVSIEAKYLKRSFRIVKAKADNLSGVVVGFGAGLPLKAFKPRKRRKGFSAKLWGERKVFKTAFEVQKIGNHIFIRKGKDRLPIKKLYGPGVGHILSQKSLMNELQSVGQEKLLTNTTRQIDRAIAGPKGKGRT